jgi:hypothetical protein
MRLLQALLQPHMLSSFLSDCFLPMWKYRPLVTRQRVTKTKDGRTGSESTSRLWLPWQFSSPFPLGLHTPNSQVLGKRVSLCWKMTTGWGHLLLQVSYLLSEPHKKRLFQVKNSPCSGMAQVRLEEEALVCLCPCVNLCQCMLDMSVCCVC